MRFMSSIMTVAAIMLVFSAGCQDDQRMDPESLVQTDPLEQLAGADRERSTEVHLVEQMARYRDAYQEHLSLMIDFYDRQGNHQKATWAEMELAHLEQGPRRNYLMVGESAGPELRAQRAIPSADELYDQGTMLFDEGKGALGSTLAMNRGKLWQAIDMYEELITQYPQSDKIDDAAFQIGQIYHRYLNDPYSALVYYQRSLQWDQQSGLPVRFAIAQTYDERIRNKVLALRYYEQAINLESQHTDNVNQAHNRIKEITAELNIEQ